MIDPTPITDLHDHAARLLAQLEALDIERAPAPLRQRLRLHRADLEALVDLTRPENARHLCDALRRRDRRLTVEELWALVRVEARRAGIGTPG